MKARPIRVRALRAGDRAAVVALVSRIENFRPAEKTVAVEVLDAFLAAPGRDYFALGAFEGEALLGYLVYGAVPMTEGTYDLYWIAVDRTARKRGAGRALVEAMERLLAAGGARKVFLETEDTPGYAGTNAFYAAAGYTRAARLPDFYRPGAAKVVWSKDLRGGA